MKTSIVFILFSLITLNVSAQILKVKKGSIDSDSSNYFMGGIGTDFKVNNKSTTAEKQVTYVGLEAESDVIYVGKKHAYILINELDYYKSTGGPLISTGYTHFRINLMRKNRLSYELFTQVQYDDGRNMPLRYLEGGGLKYRLISNENAQLFMGIGAMYERENWKRQTEDGGIIEKGILKTSSYISGNFPIKDIMNINVITYYQGGYDNDSDVFRNRFSGDLVIAFKITNKLAFKTSFTAQYEDKPIININKFVYEVTQGLAISF